MTSDQYRSERVARPRIWPCLAIFFVAIPLILVAQSVLIVSLIAIKGLPLSEAEKMVQAPGTFVACLIACQLIYAGLSLFPAWRSPQSVLQRLGFVRPRIGIGGIVITMIGSLFVWQLGSLCWMLCFKEISPSLRSTATTITQASPSVAILLICCASVLPGVCEEMLFRGYIQRRLLARWSPLWAVGFTCLGFAVAHLDPQHIVALIPLGLWLGYVAWRSDSVWPTVCSHTLVNAMAFGTVFVMGMEFAEASNLRFTLAVLSLSLPFFLAAVTNLERVSRNYRHEESTRDESCDEQETR